MRKTNLCEKEEEVEGVTVEAEQGDEEEQVEEEPSFITPPPAAETRSADLSALPADVWVRIANVVAERESANARGRSCRAPSPCRAIPSHPCLLYSLSQAPCLESLLIEHGIGSDSDRDMPRKHCNDPVMVAEMLEIISIMEEANKNYKDRPFPVLRRLSLYLSACLPLILCFISAQLHSLDLAAEDQFAALEGKEGAISSKNARERDADVRSSFSLDLSVATVVRLNGLNCSISLSAPRLFSLCFQWRSRDSRLLLLPTCPAHVTSLFLQTDPICPWALHVPHLTSLHSLCTDMDSEQATCLPPGVIKTVKVLEWRNPMDSQSLDLSAWHGLRCLHAVGWAPVSLSVFRSAEVWSCDLEGMFFSSIGSKVVGFFESGLGGGGGGEILGTSHGGKGTSRDRALPLRHKEGRSYYNVQPGDNLTKIAGQLGSTVEILMQANSLLSDILHPGQSLWVPHTYTIANVCSRTYTL
ncbi:unnamed protein product [Closterium sp. Naga37s-1]|nr:unnamed protein product [Closterium sp. Naga37s-1]